MPRQNRIDAPEDLHHIIARGIVALRNLRGDSFSFILKEAF